ncbi:MAG: ADP-ribosylglycohydrolase family protein [Candidatus Brocadiia bacterium]
MDEIEMEDLLAFAREELKTRSEQGCDTWELERELKLLGQVSSEQTAKRLKSILDVLEHLRPTEDFPYREPSDLEQVRDQRPEGPRSLGVGIGEETLRQKTLGGWLGRVAGCMLGKPVEGWERFKIQHVLEEAKAYPLDDYFPLVPGEEKDLPEKELELRRGHITHGMRDDDTDYTIIGLRALEEKGKNFDSRDIAQMWLELLPYQKTYTAERVAYRNIVNGLWPPESARYRNAYREWIGAQIRADAWGYACPARPQEAAELAYRDAVVSHTRNGIYGEMWVAAMIAAAFATDSPRRIIEIGLSEIPGDSRLNAAIRQVIEWYEEDLSAEDATTRLLEEFGEYSPVHTINNAAIVAMALLWGGEDFTRGVGLAVMAGLDTDCNGATVGSVTGVMIGEEGIPENWKQPLNDRLESAVFGDFQVRISDLAARTLPLQRLRVSE